MLSFNFSFEFLCKERRAVKKTQKSKKSAFFYLLIRTNKVELKIFLSKSELIISSRYLKINKYKISYYCKTTLDFIAEFFYLSYPEMYKRGKQILC